MKKISQRLNKKMIVMSIAILGTYTLLALGMRFNWISYYASGMMVSILINIIMAVSLALVTGYLGELVLGHAGFMAIGAYISALITQYVDLPIAIVFPLALLCGAIGASFIGILIGIPALRLRGDYLGIITLGFGEIIRITLNNLKITNGARGLTGIAPYTNFTFAFFITVAVILFINRLIHSRHGKNIIAIRENEIAADCVGLSTFYYKTYAFSIAAFFAGIAGGLYAHYYQVLNPQSFGFMYSIEYLVIVVLGGMGNLVGTIIAAVTLGILNEWLRAFAQYRMLVYSATLIAIVILKAQGVTIHTVHRSLKGIMKGLIKRENKCLKEEG